MIAFTCYNIYSLKNNEGETYRDRMIDPLTTNESQSTSLPFFSKERMLFIQ